MTKPPKGSHSIDDYRARVAHSSLLLRHPQCRRWIAATGDRLAEAVEAEGRDMAAKSGICIARAKGDEPKNCPQPDALIVRVGWRLCENAVFGGGRHVRDVSRLLTDLG